MATEPHWTHHVEVNLFFMVSDSNRSICIRLLPPPSDLGQTSFVVVCLRAQFWDQSYFVYICLFLWYIIQVWHRILLFCWWYSYIPSYVAQQPHWSVLLSFNVQQIYCARCPCNSNKKYFCVIGQKNVHMKDKALTWLPLCLCPNFQKNKK